MTRTLQTLLVTLATIASAACHGIQDTPTGILGPSGINIPPTPAPAPTPRPSSPFSVALEIVRPQQNNPAMVSWQALVTVTATPGVISPALPSSVELECGTGSVQRREGFYGTDVFTCLSPNDGTFQTRAIANGTGGFSAQAATSVTVARNLPPFNVALEVSGPGPVQDVGDGKGRSVSYVVHVTPDHRLAASYEYDFGDGVKTGEISNHSQTHVYTRAGSYTAIISVKSTDGRHQKVSKTVDIAL